MRLKRLLKSPFCQLSEGWKRKTPVKLPPLSKALTQMTINEADYYDELFVPSSYRESPRKGSLPGGIESRKNSTFSSQAFPPAVPVEVAPAVVAA